ncbi:1-phosphofructokinase family hexose kinase [Alicyclobacillus dauci]|uniref:Tagatose-6-phosphate kinase n=1 Tax=Alicyclobacillus dauci TaxID=1475485 RepID=A0ABY6Z5D9_9BACL|nr:1-phosphofructokinase family hexose kinase [Alicyclobacillus dauci]WAH37974.1 1-phosphofructokinase family hexose kinase [Alicyclobacillus dauci]
MSFVSCTDITRATRNEVTQAVIRVVGLNASMDRTQRMVSVHLGEVNRSTHTDVYAGGKGLGVARAIKTLGPDVVVYGFVGGITGRFLRQTCEALGIEDRQTEIQGETRICNILVDDSTSQVTVLNEKGPWVSEAEVEKMLLALLGDCEEGDIVVLSGSIPSGVPSSIYRQMIEQLNPVGVKTIVDTSGIPLRESATAKPWIIKPNLSEFQELIGSTDIPSLKTVAEESRKFLNESTYAVIVTLGEQGVITVLENECFLAKAPKVPVVNPTASGDTFLGAFVVDLLQSGDMKNSVRFACGCAAANVMNFSPGIPERFDIGPLVEQVTIEELEVMGL